MQRGTAPRTADRSRHRAGKHVVLLWLIAVVRIWEGHVLASAQPGRWTNRVGTALLWALPAHVERFDVPESLHIHQSFHTKDFDVQGPGHLIGAGQERGTLLVLFVDFDRFSQMGVLL